MAGSAAPDFADAAAALAGSSTSFTFLAVSALDDAAKEGGPIIVFKTPHADPDAAAAVVAAADGDPAAAAAAGEPPPTGVAVVRAGGIHVPDIVSVATEEKVLSRITHSLLRCAVGVLFFFCFFFYSGGLSLGLRRRLFPRRSHPVSAHTRRQLKREVVSHKETTARPHDSELLSSSHARARERQSANTFVLVFVARL